MKKALVTLLALVVVMVLASTAMAATSGAFADVPAKHWSYGAVAKLAKDGIISGYNDGTFRGDKTLTRYEMAQIVANAITKEDKADAGTRAIIGKLATEFAVELNNLGVRVANLEANASSVKITGDVRFRFINLHDSTKANDFYERIRLNMNAKINEDTSFYGRIMTGYLNQGTGTLVTGPTVNTPDGNPNKSSYLILGNAQMTTKNIFNTGATFILGRQSWQGIGPTGYVVSAPTGMLDAAQIAFKVDRADLSVGYGDFSPAMKNSPNALVINKALFANLKYPTSKATSLYVSYLNQKSAGEIAGASNVKFTLSDFGIVTKVTQNLTLTAETFRNTAVATTPKGYLARLTYKDFNPAVKGSWTAFAEYYKTDANLAPNYSDFNTTNNVSFGNDKKAWDIQASFAVAKNIQLDAIQTFNTKVTSTGASAPNYSRVNITYYF